jgi:hypothetical protein
MSQNLTLAINITADGKVAKTEIIDVGKTINNSMTGVEKDSQKAGSALNSFASITETAKEKARELTSRLGPLGDMLLRLGSGGLLAGAAIAGISGVLLKGVNSANKKEVALGRLESVLKATGYSAKLSAKEIYNFSRELETSTLANSNQILEASAVLATFRSVADDTFKRTISLSQDLSAVFGQDLKSSAMQLGKALEDPIQGLNALRRVGVSFDDEQKKLIKTLAETGQVALAQAKILDVLEQQVGGAGAGEAVGLAGATDNLSASFRVLFETIGELPGLSSLAVGAVNSLSAVFKGATAVIAFFNEAVLKIGDYLLGAFDIAFAKISGFPEFVERGFNRVVNFFYTALPKIGNIFIGTFTAIGETVLISAEGLTRAFLNAFAEIGKRIGNFANALKLAFSGDFKAAGEEASKMFSTEFNLGLADTGKEIVDSFKRNLTKDHLGEAIDNVSGIMQSAGEHWAEIAGKRYNERLKKQVGESGKTLNALAVENKNLDGTAKSLNETFEKHIISLKDANQELDWELDGKKALIPQLKAERDLRRELGSLTEKQVLELSNLYEKNRELNKTLEERKNAEETAKKADEERLRRSNEVTDKIVDYGADKFENWFNGQKNSWQDLANDALSIMKRMFAQMAAEAVIRPIIAPIIGGALGLSSGSAVAGGVSGVAGGLSGIGSSIAGSGLGIGTALNAASLLSLGQSQWLGNAAVSLAMKAGVENASALAAFGNAGLNLPWTAVGSLAANMFGLGSSNPLINMGMSTVGGLGGAAFGATLGSIGGPIGAIVGSFLGSALSGLFGGGKQKTPNWSNYLGWDPSRGGYFENSLGGYANPVPQVSWLYKDVLEEFMGQTGLDFDRSKKTDLGSFSFVGEISQSSMEQQFATQIAKLITDNIFLNVPPALAKLVNEAGNDAEKLTNAVNTWMIARAELTNNLNALAADTVELTQVEASFKNLTAQFAEMRTQASELGVSLALVSTAENAQIKKLVEAYNFTTRQEILKRINPFSAAMEEWTKWADDTRREATLIGADMLQVEELIGLKRIEILEAYGEEIEESERRISVARKKALNENLESFLNELRGSTQFGTSATDALAFTLNEFDAIKTEALAGSAKAIEELAASGKKLIQLYEAVFAHSEDFWTGRNYVESSIEAVQAKIPQFAEGGYHSGGLRIVGERGKELEWTPPSRIFNADETKTLLSGGDNSKVSALIAKLTAVLESYRGQSAQETAGLIHAIENLRAEMVQIRRKLDREAA